jgi:hypothetical protein
MIFAGLSRVRVTAGRKSTLAALAAAIGVAIAGAVLWGLVALLIHRQLSLLGLLIGGGVGSVVARYRAGHLPTIIAGAVIAVAGCALGTLLGVVFTLLKEHVTISQILAHFSLVARSLSPGNLGALGLLFYAVAAYAAIRVPLPGRRPGRAGAAGPPFDAGAGEAGAADYGAAGSGAADYGAADYGAAGSGAADYGTAGSGAADYGAAGGGAAGYGAGDYRATDYGASGAAGHAGGITPAAMTGPSPAPAAMTGPSPAPAAGSSPDPGTGPAAGEPGSGAA